MTVTYDPQAAQTNDIVELNGRARRPPSAPQVTFRRAAFVQSVGAGFVKVRFRPER
jgi:hypothetical protein